MKTKRMFLSANCEFGRIWYSLSEAPGVVIDGYMPIGLIDLPVDEEEVIKNLDVFNKAQKEAKRAKLLAELAKLDEKEQAA